MRTSSSNTTEKPHNNESNSNELLQKVEIEDTPFTAIRYDDKWF